MKRLLLRWVITAGAIAAAFWLVPGIHPTQQSVKALFAVALIFGLVNAVVRPIVKLFTCPLLLLTLGLGILLVNALMFWLAGYVGNSFGVGFTVDGPGAAVAGALVVSVASFVLSLVFAEDLKEKD